MKTDSKKLVELLRNAKAAMKAENLSCDLAKNMFVADFLIVNGVTVQEWISVKDRLPKKNRKAVLIALRWEETDIGWYDKDDKCWQSEFVNEYEDGEVTHWMPLPPAPKGEQQCE